MWNSNRNCRHGNCVVVSEMERLQRSTKRSTKHSTKHNTKRSTKRNRHLNLGVSQ